MCLKTISIQIFLLILYSFVSVARKPSLSRSRKVKEEKPKLMLEDLDALEDLQSLVDSLLEKEEVDNEGDFLIFLRLSPIPKYLVKGYDFKMLNK